MVRTRVIDVGSERCCFELQRKSSAARPDSLAARLVVGNTLRVAALGIIVAALCGAVATAETAEQVFRQVSRSVVVIHASDAAGNPVELGSGVVIYTGAVITNCHVAESAPRLEVVSMGKGFTAALRYADTDRDMCELTVPHLPAPPVSLARLQSLQVGQRVYAIGAPEGLDLTLSEGLISALRSFDGLTYIQTTAPISPGSSGGGLFDDQGRLIGITTFFVDGGQNLNFALPADLISGLAARAGNETRKTANTTTLEFDLIQRAAILEDTADWRRLRDLSVGWIGSEPDDPSAWVALADAYDNLHQYDEAVIADRKALRLDPNHLDAWLGLGDDYTDLRQFEKALAAEKAAVQINPGSAKAWAYLAFGYGILGQRNQALVAETQAVQLDPKNAEAWVYIGSGYTILQQYDRALLALQEALRLDPNSDRGWTGLGSVRERLKQYEAAAAAERQAIKRGPRNPVAWADLGSDCAHLQDYGEALAAEQRAIRLDPNYADAWYELGLDYCSLGQLDPAIAVYQRLRELDRDKADRLFRACIAP